MYDTQLGLSIRDNPERSVNLFMCKLTFPLRIKAVMIKSHLHNILKGDKEVKLVTHLCLVSSNLDKNALKL